MKSGRKSTSKRSKHKAKRERQSNSERLYNQFFGGDAPFERLGNLDYDPPDRGMTLSIRQFATYGAYEDPI